MHLAQLARTPALDGLLDDTLNNMVEAIEVQSTFGPPIFIREPFRKTAAAPPAGGGGGGGAVPALPGFDVARMLKPKVIVHWRNEADPAQFMPYGDPGPSRWPWVVIGLVAGLSFLTYRAFWACPRRRA